MSSSALEDARARVVTTGGTLGEALVASGTIADDALTEFYCSRLLVPKVNPNNLARLSARVIAAIPTDMAIELRAIPVSLDNENNLTVAMSDPSDRHAVDQIAFFTQAYVVRAVATQMQIAWCLAHYYGHVTPLGQKLLQPTQPDAPAPAQPQRAAASGELPVTPSASGKIPRTRGLTGKVEAARHRAMPPMTGPVAVQRPNSKLLDDPTPAPIPAEPAPPASDPAGGKPASADQGATDGVPMPRPRTASGEIRVPGRRAPSVKPPLPEDESGPVITMEVDEPEEEAPKPKVVQRRQRVVREDPPELAARAGEVELRSRHHVEHDAEPSIMVDTGALTPPAAPELAETTGEFESSKPSRRLTEELPKSTVEVDEDDESLDKTARIRAPLADVESQPILLDRRRPSDGLKSALAAPVAQVAMVASTETEALDDPDSVVVLTPKLARTPRPEKRTQVGVVPNAAVTRLHRDTEAGVPGEIDDAPTASQRIYDGDTLLDGHAAPPDDSSDGTDGTDETIAPPPPPNQDDTNPNLLAVPPKAAASKGHPAAANADDDDDDDDDDDEDDDDDDDVTSLIVPRGKATAVMSVAELDAIIPGRSVVPSHLDTRRRSRIDYDPVDDGWGAPGTTIPPPLLGAIPGSGDDGQGPGEIPMPDVDQAPLIVSAPAPPEPARGVAALGASGQTLARALEEATSHAIELIHSLETARDRDEIIRLLIAHLAGTHQRAGFFVIKNSELAVFAMTPKPEMIPFATLRLDRASTLQDVVGTRLPYRGPMHDDASRRFLATVLGACPPEILLVPIAIRERVVGVLFGEHRLRHTFDDQLALAARAAGMSLERILRTKRT